MIRSKCLQPTSLLGVALVATLAMGVSMGSVAQNSDIPELTGTWTNSSRTSLSRQGRDLPLVVSAEEAQEIVLGMGLAGTSAEAIREGIPVDEETGLPPAGSQDFGTRGYDFLWTDPGETLAYVKGEYRTSLVIDPPNGRIPNRDNPEVDFPDTGINFGVRFFTGEGDARGPEALPIEERCLVGFGNHTGPGMLPTLYNSTYDFVQTDDHVVILTEMVHDSRIIPLFTSAEEARANSRPAVHEPWFGDARGWYEDGWLIVETVNIRPLQMSHSSIQITKQGKITERFQRFSDTEIVYQFTVDDPNLYTQPWTAEMSFHAYEDEMYEYACHEGNYSMPGILAGARRQEVEEELDIGQ